MEAQSTNGLPLNKPELYRREMSMGNLTLTQENFYLGITRIVWR